MKSAFRASQPQAGTIDSPVAVEINEKDRPILATAIRQKCDILLTGDKRDFGHLFGQQIENTTVLPPIMLKDVLHRL